MVTRLVAPGHERRVVRTNTHVYVLWGYTKVYVVRKVWLALFCPPAPTDNCTPPPHTHSIRSAVLAVSSSHCVTPLELYPLAMVYGASAAPASLDNAPTICDIRPNNLINRIIYQDNTGNENVVATITCVCVCARARVCVRVCVCVCVCVCIKCTNTPKSVVTLAFVVSECWTFYFHL